MRFYTDQALSANRSKTPEGFLILTNVPVARTGMQIYGEGETPIEGGDAEGKVKIHRTPEEVFNKETLASFEGKPLVVEHPDEDVTPDNWADLSKGVVLNVRQGVGAQDDLMMGDILVYDQETIKKIENGDYKELSAGYDASYIEGENPGEGYQKDIRGNHIALVENARCGPRCRIPDSAGGVMSKFRDAIKKAFWSKDEKSLDEALAGIDGEAKDQGIPGENAETHIHIHQEGGDPGVPSRIQSEQPLPRDEEGVDQEFMPENVQSREPDPRDRFTALENALDSINDRLAALEGSSDTGDVYEDENMQGADVEEDEQDRRGRDKEVDSVEDETSDGVRDEAYRVSDSRYMEESIQQTLAAAEVLAPGISFPTFDRKSHPGATAANLTGLRKKALAIYASTTDGASTLSEMSGGYPLTPQDLKRLPASETKIVFFAAAASAKQRNRDQAKKFSMQDASAVGPVNSIAEMNKRNREFWSKRVM